MTKELLRIEDLHAWYGESHILHGVNFEVREGEVEPVRQRFDIRRLDRGAAPDAQAGGRVATP